MSQTDTHATTTGSGTVADSGTAVGGGDERKAGAFDLRNVIGALFGLYGVILLLAYFLVDPGVDASTGEAKEAVYNLWSGVGLVVAALIFFGWAKLNPIVVKED